MEFNNNRLSNELWKVGFKIVARRTFSLWQTYLLIYLKCFVFSVLLIVLSDWHFGLIKFYANITCEDKAFTLSSNNNKNRKKNQKCENLKKKKKLQTRKIQTRVRKINNKYTYALITLHVNKHTHTLLEHGYLSKINTHYFILTQQAHSRIHRYTHTHTHTQF